MRNFKSLIFSIGLIFGMFPSFGQVFSWREPDATICYKIDFHTNRLLFTTPQGTWQDMGEIQLQNIKSLDLYSNSENINPVKIPGKRGTYLLIECSGQVYYFDVSTRTISREDLTFFRGANCQAVQFARKGIFYSFGGYGFWQSTNILTQYNQVAKEWTHILASGDVPQAINQKSAAYLPSLDRFITVGVRRINQTESADVVNLDYSLIEYLFGEKKFKKLGEVQEPILKNILAAEENNFVLALDHYIIISPQRSIPGYNHDLLYIIDVKDSFKGYLWTNPARFQIRKFVEERGILYNVFVRGKSLFLPQASETYPYGKFHVAEIPIQTLLAESKPLGAITEKPILDNLQEMAILVLVIVVLFIVLRFFILLKKRKKKKQLAMLLGSNESQFLDFLRLNYRQGHVSGHQIIAFFGKHKSSPESQRQFRAKLIDGLTKSLGLVFPGEQVLDIQADEKDQRMLTYRLTDSIYKELKNL